MPKTTESQSNSTASTPAHTQNTSTDQQCTSDGRVATFIKKVYNILEEQLFPDIVDWSQDGLSIVIKKPTEFSQKVLPKYFKHNHISSFIRQLNMYSFQKKRSRHAGHIYAHDLFQKGAKHLLCQIKRKVKDFGNTSTGSGQEAPASTTPSALANTPNPNSNAVSAGPDVTSLMNENQALKSMQEQAMSKMNALEQRIKELTAMNQTLHAQLQGKAIMENKRPEVQQAQAQQIYNLNKAMMIGGKNPFNMGPNMNGNIKQEDHIQNLSPVKGLSLKINKPPSQNEAERFMLGGQNTFRIGANFATINPNVKTVKSGDDISPSTRPSPHNSENIVSDLDPWGQQLLQQQQQQQQQHQQSMHQFQHVQQNFQNLQNMQHRLSISQTQGIFSNFSDSNNMQGFANVLGKRELELEEAKPAEEPLKKFMQKNWNDAAATLNLKDIRKFHSNLFSSIGDKEFDPKPNDTEVDLLCFE